VYLFSINGFPWMLLETGMFCVWEKMSVIFI